MDETVREIVRASYLPVSIVIVGVGGADFEKMDILDADEEPLSAVIDGKLTYQQRDNVQFVPFREFKNDKYKLARETLQEIPGQLTDYFLTRGIYPKPATEAERAKIQKKLSLRQNADPNE